MEIVDFALRRFLFLPDSCDAFEFLRDGWLARRASPLAWRWSNDPKIEVAHDRGRGAYFAIIEPRDPCAAELYFHWVNEGSRGMARGSREQLKGVAARIRAAGGPFGSADVYFSNNLPPNELTVQPPATGLLRSRDQAVRPHLVRGAGYRVRRQRVQRVRPDDADSPAWPRGLLRDRARARVSR